MKFALSAVALALFGTFSPISQAQALNLPLQLDYGLIAKLVTNSLYTGAEHTADLWQDGAKCSYLKLANLKINGQAEQIRLTNDVQVQFGTKLGGQCVTVLKWQGVLETLQKPTLNADHSVLSLPVTQATAYDQQGHQVNISQLQDLLKRVVEPKLAGLSIDLNRLHGDMERNVSTWLPKTEAAQLSQWLNTLTINSAAANDQGIALQLGLDAPASTPAQAPSLALTASEQKQWQVIWKQWQGLLAKAINGLGKDQQNQALQTTLTAMLHESNTAFQAGLTAKNTTDNDPVREFFSHSWTTLTPQLKAFSQDLPGLEGFNYLGAIAATDVLYELDTKAAPLGITLSSDGLRKLARLLIAGKQQRT
ncbi:hypothetical protein [Methylovulum psychrotolerans]|uniref:DUF945 domain-containing protein n=1 Tax=Methylovulum psychrotolerans TaxID=1704499 RepID=A0A2S5CS41_9GAMM|nr:hypothetical protein [Methylovulum psychrotolerans]POZ53624.1 hypothetical protein AADEFJLK_00659 [Methylovulum psychrotolerans]